MYVITLTNYTFLTYRGINIEQTTNNAKTCIISGIPSKVYLSEFNAYV